MHISSYIDTKYDGEFSIFRVDIRVSHQGAHCGVYLYTRNKPPEWRRVAPLESDLSAYLFFELDITQTNGPSAIKFYHLLPEQMNNISKSKHK